MTHGSIDLKQGLKNDFELLNKEQDGIFLLREFQGIAAAHYGATEEDCKKFLAKKMLAGECKTVFVGVDCYITTLSDNELKN